MNKKDAKHSNSEDSKLFRDAVRDAKPIAGPNRHHSLPKPRKALARARRADEQAVLTESLRDPLVSTDIETGEELLFRSPGLSPKRWRDLRRGRIAVQAYIDLHGLTRNEARTQLHLFIAESTTAGKRCVRIVHGKGRGSGDRGPVLKTGVNEWLRNWNQVMAFCSARPTDGGTGAVYVLLRANSPRQHS